MLELLVAGVEFPDLGTAKIEVEHTVFGFDNLVATLKEQHPSTLDIPTSPEQYIEEIGLGDYIQVMLVDLALEARAIRISRASVSMKPLTESTSQNHPGVTSIHC